MKKISYILLVVTLCLAASLAKSQPQAVLPTPTVLIAGDPILSPMDDPNDDPYAWYEAACVWERNTVRIRLESRKPNNGLLELSLPLEDEQLGNPSSFRFTDRDKKTWAIQHNFPTSQCTSNSFEVSRTQQGTLTGFSLSLECTRLFQIPNSALTDSPLDRAEQTNPRAWVKVSKNNPIRCQRN